MSPAESIQGKRIGIDITSALTQGAGIGRYTRELVAALVETDQVNTFALFSAKRPAQLAVPDPIPAADHLTYHEAPLGERWLSTDAMTRSG